MLLTGRSRSAVEKPFPLVTCPPQISHELALYFQSQKFRLKTNTLHNGDQSLKCAYRNNHC